MKRIAWFLLLNKHYSISYLSGYILDISARAVPFVVGVHTDDDEVTNASGTATAITNEQAIVPGGITGFHLTYALQC